jgi:putative DNA primase/helicase
MLNDGKAINSNSDHYAQFGDKMHPDAASNCEIEYFIVPEIFRKEMCAGFNHLTMARLLIARGALMPEKDGRPDRKERLPIVDNTRCYRLLPKLFSDDE